MTPERLKELKAWAGAIASDAPDEAQAWRETLDALETEMADKRHLLECLAEEKAAYARAGGEADALRSAAGKARRVLGSMLITRRPGMTTLFDHDCDAAAAVIAALNEALGKS